MGGPFQPGWGSSYFSLENHKEKFLFNRTFFCLLTANLGESAVCSSKCSSSQKEKANVFQGEKETLPLKPVSISCGCFTQGLRFGKKWAQLFLNTVLDGFFWDLTAASTPAGITISFRNGIYYYLSLLSPLSLVQALLELLLGVIGSRIWSCCLQWWHLRNKHLLFQNVWVYSTLGGILQ